MGGCVSTQYELQEDTKHDHQNTHMSTTLLGGKKFRYVLAASYICYYILKSPKKNSNVHYIYVTTSDSSSNSSWSRPSLAEPLLCAGAARAGRAGARAWRTRPTTSAAQVTPSAGSTRSGRWRPGRRRTPSEQCPV